MPEGQSTERATALLALWNDVDPAHIEAYEAWHAQEHVPERCTVPGILWGRRYGWIAGGAMPRYLTLYGLREPQVLDSEPYRRLLREPTPMSRRMRPALQNVSRWVCRLHENRLGADAADLAVWTLADGADGDVPGRRLRAERILDAAPLPWLGRDQGLGIEGRWLCAAGTDAAAPGAAIYTRLPVGAA